MPAPTPSPRELVDRLDSRHEELLQKLDEAGPIRKALVFVRLGDIHDKLGEKPKAIQMYERAVQTDDKLEEAKQKLEAARAS